MMDHATPRIGCAARPCTQSELNPCGWVADAAQPVFTAQMQQWLLLCTAWRAGSWVLGSKASLAAKCAHCPVTCQLRSSTQEGYKLHVPSAPCPPHP
jgi:hypothetical protein